MDSRFARIVACALGITLAAAAVAAPDDAARAHHPWAKFPPGTWIRLKSVNDYELEGKQHHEESSQKITLKAVTDAGVKLVTDSKDGGNAGIVESTEPLDDFEPWTGDDRKKASRETLTIEGKEIPCEVVRFDRTKKDAAPFADDGIEIHAVGTAWVNDAYPTPLKLDVETSFGDEKQHMVAVVEHLDVEIKIGATTFHCVELVTRDAATEGSEPPTSVQHTWCCKDVPGGMVRSRAEMKSDKVTGTFVSEVTELFIAPVQEVIRTSETVTASPGLSDECEVTARFVDSEGSPVAGLVASVNGRTHDVTAAAKAGAAPRTVRLTGATDADGRLTVDVVALPGAEYFVEVRGPGVAKEVWRLRALTPGGHVDLGEISTRPCGSIVGHMLTSDGRPVPGGFYVQATQKGDDEQKRGANRESMYEYGSPKEGSSDYRVDNIPAGTYEVAPYVHAVGWFHEGNRTVDVVAGQETRLDLVYSGPAIEQRVHIVTFVEPFYVLNPARDHVWLKTADGRTLAASDGGMQAFNFDGVPEGACTLTIDDPRFEKVTRSGLRAGSRTDVRVRGAGSLVIIARDAKTSAPIVDVSVSQELLKVNFSPRRFTLRGIGGPPLHDGLLTGVLPGDTRLFVGASGYAESAIDLKGLEPDEPRTLEVALQSAGAATSTAPASIGGVVSDAKTQKPIAGVAIEAQCTDRDEWETKRATSDARGHFRIDGLKRGRWNVQAKRSETVESSTYRVELDGGEKRDDIDLELPPGVIVDGGISGLAGFAGLDIELKLLRSGGRFGDASFESGNGRFAFFGGQDAHVERDGRYVAKDVAPGHYRIALEFGRARISLGPSHTGESPPQHAQLGEIDVTEDPEQHFDFDAGAFTPGSVAVRVDGDARLRGSIVVVARTADPPAKEPQEGETFSSGDDEEGDDDGGDETLGAHDPFSFSAFRDAEDDVAGAIANLGIDMTGRLSLPAGRWLVGVRSNDGAWTIDAPRPIALAMGEAAQVAISIELVTASVALIDSRSRAPLAKTSIRWLHSTSPREVGLTAISDGEGRLTITAPRGRVKLWIAPKSSRKRDDPTLATECDWPPKGEVVPLQR